MIAARIACIAILASAAAASDSVVVRVDQPDRWYQPGTSHHGKHAAGGLALGAVTFAAVPAARATRYAVATAVGAAVGLGFELARGRDGSSYVDPVDVAWTTAGAAAGAALADLAGFAISATVNRRGASLGVRITF